MTIFEEKKNLRSQMRKLLKEKYSDEAVRFKASRNASEQVIATKAYREADYIFMYVPKSPEADDMFIEYCGEKEGKKICVPRVLDEESCAMNKMECQMEFFLLDKDTGLEWQLEEGAFGILEPVLTRPYVDLESGELDGKNVLFVIPGLAFTEDGKRLGKGKGYYDRFIPRLKACNCNVTTMGFAYIDQKVETLPADKNDFVLDCVIFGKA